MARTLITAALPYVNSYIHLGHLAGAYLPADMYARFLRLQGREVLFVCGCMRLRVCVAEAHVCLLHTLRALGVAVRHAGAGPFWALRDGNRFLREFDMHLRHVPETPREHGDPYDLQVTPLDWFE